MNDLKSVLLDRKIYLENVITETGMRLAAAPPGFLRYAKKGQTIQYYHRKDKKDKNGHYICKKDFHLIRELAQKDYDDRVLRAAQRELAGIEKNLAAFPPISPEDVYSFLPPIRQELVKPIRLTDEQFTKAWLAMPYERKPFPDDVPEFFTAKGERVRSKSEILIADTLFRMNIPYRYEYPLLLEDGRVLLHPDFYVLNVRLRKPYFWEHLGRMDDPKYSGRALSRIDLFERNGFFPGRDLILSFESLTRPLNTQTIEQMIRAYLL